MNNLFLDIDASAIDWARAQFALTAIYHWLFVPLTLGLAVIMGICETYWYRSRDTFWRDTASSSNSNSAPTGLTIHGSWATFLERHWPLRVS